MIYEIRDAGFQTVFRGRLKTWDGVITDASPDSMALLIGYKIEDALYYLTNKHMTWQVHPDPAPALKPVRREPFAMMQG